jgi:hypothetical protein
VSERLRRARGGVRGGVQGARGFGGSAPEIFFFGPTYFRRFRADILSPGRDDIFPGPHDIRWFSAHGFLPMVFYFRLRN